MDHSIVAVLQGGEPTLGQPDPRGAVLRIVGGTWQVLRYFEGESPSGQPWIEPDGAIVGTTRQPSGGGSVFRLEPLK